MFSWQYDFSKKNHLLSHQTFLRERKDRLHHHRPDYSEHLLSVNDWKMSIKKMRRKDGRKKEEVRHAASNVSSFPKRKFSEAIKLYYIPDSVSKYSPSSHTSRDFSQITSESNSEWRSFYCSNNKNWQSIFVFHGKFVSHRLLCINNSSTSPLPPRFHSAIGCMLSTQFDSRNVEENVL